MVLGVPTANSKDKRIADRVLRPYRLKCYFLSGLLNLGDKLTILYDPSVK